MRRALLPGVLAVPLSLALCAGCSGPAPAGTVPVTVSRGACAPQWTAPRSGVTTFAIRNVDIATGEVDLIDPASGGVYAEIESLAPGTTRSMRLTLGRGGYAFRCLLEDTDAVTGPTVRVADGPPGVAVRPVTDQDLRDAVRAYRAYVSAGLDTLAADTVVLDRALHRGSVANARAAWVTAQVDYTRLGAAYDTFGDLADSIDGLPDGLPGGVADPDFAGLRRLEYGLWHGQAPASLGPVGDQLVADVADLRRSFPDDQTDPNDLPLRAHEILEDSVQFELTGAADQGSGTGLAAIAANLVGTRAVLDALAPVFTARYPGWVTVGPALSRVDGLLTALRRSDGSWPAVAALAPGERERLDGAMGDLLETLAPIAAIGDVRRVS